ncbi:hypothetical protein NEIRO03_0722 [Nematocida sp. AWRm78]|nr:hypothetical protein NEIRO02_0928 [Nematocida sp. AWRm79]KAI5183098.1 hypothetical protein NEIRO03_0722 [Nematocida sp. AWRm78]
MKNKFLSSEADKRNIDKKFSTITVNETKEFMNNQNHNKHAQCQKKIYSRISSEEPLNQYNTAVLSEPEVNNRFTPSYLNDLAFIVYAFKNIFVHSVIVFLNTRLMWSICNPFDILWLVILVVVVFLSSSIDFFVIRPLITRMYMAFMDINPQDTGLFRNENEQDVYRKNIMLNNILCSIIALILLILHPFCPSMYALIEMIIMQFSCVLSAFAWSGFLVQIIRIYLKGGFKKKNVLNHEASHKKNIFLLSAMFMITILTTFMWWSYFIILVFGPYIFIPDSLYYDN